MPGTGLKWWRQITQHLYVNTLIVTYMLSKSCYTHDWYLCCNFSHQNHHNHNHNDHHDCCSSPILDVNNSVCTVSFVYTPYKETVLYRYFYGDNTNYSTIITNTQIQLNCMTIKTSCCSSLCRSNCFFRSRILCSVGLLTTLSRMTPTTLSFAVACTRADSDVTLPQTFLALWRQGEPNCSS